jgi:hypothetical protein
VSNNTTTSSSTICSNGNVVEDGIIRITPILLVLIFHQINNGNNDTHLVSPKTLLTRAAVLAAAAVCMQWGAAVEKVVLEQVSHQV